MKFLFYCLCGFAGVCSDYFVYSVAVLYGVWYQYANIIGYFSGTIVSFYLNSKITFQVQDRVGFRLGLFILIAFLGFLSSVVLLWLMVDYFHLDARIAKLLTLPCVVILQYSLNRRFTFKI